MKQLFYFSLAFLSIIACKKEPKNYLSFSGKITDKNSDSLLILNPKTGFKKTIKLNSDGTFSDTLNIKSGLHVIFDGKEKTTAYFKNGLELNMTLDTKNFHETVSFSGEGATESNFLAEAFLLEEGLIKNREIFNLSKEDFDAKLKSYTANFKKRLLDNNSDSIFVADQEKRLNTIINYIEKYYNQTSSLTKGMVSPKFVNYENFTGGTTSLDDLKGKYVFIDIWATWCIPCLNQIPFLKKVEKEFHGKNIEFIGISIDQKKDHELWKKMVVDKELKGTQLFADNNWNSDFIKSYKINGIPRFILIDPEGNIIDSKTPRPSDPELMKLLKSLKL
ncbi:TlpA family protein disulfide reductase [Tenacibaculum sp. C7A-26P2]|uniref:TlpA family protein disulfide reductase n=1 Tax=Tenacibaculum sp. C7A-26P2 TaxID=3447504 RepID=UPI003F87FC30